MSEALREKVERAIEAQSYARLLGLKVVEAEEEEGRAVISCDKRRICCSRPASCTAA